MDTTFVDREQPRLLQELSDFLAIPSVSTLPEHAEDTRRAAEWLRAELTRLGCPVVDLIEGDGHPVVWAEGPSVPGTPHAAHLRPLRRPAAGSASKSGTRRRSQPTVRDGKLYARGAADDKGQVFCLLKAYEAVLDAAGQPPLNVRFIFEGEEECGGRVIFDLLHAEPERTRADAALVCDSAFYAPGWPAVYTALRGLCYAEISVRTLHRDLHSGSYGGVAPNALETLVRILSRLKAADGEVRIPKLYKAVEPPTKKELKAWRKLPFDEEAFLRDEVTGTALTGLEDHSVFERTWALPTFEIHGIRGGFVGDGAKTVIPAHAVAKVSLRLVPGQTLREGRPAARARGRGSGAEVGRGEGHPAPRWRPGADLGGPSGVRRAGRGVRGGRGAARGLHPLRRLDSDHPGARAHRGAGHPDRHRVARRRAALAEREAGPRSALERDSGLRQVLRAVRGAGWCGAGGGGRAASR